MPLGSYFTGTIAIAVGAVVANGTGTVWNLMNARAGDTLIVNGHEVGINDVNSLGQLAIDAWPAAFGAVVAGTAYKIRQDSPLRFVGSQAMADIGTALTGLNSLGPIFNVPTGTLVPDPSYGSDGQYAHQMVTNTWWLKTGGVWVVTFPPGGNSSTPLLANNFPGADIGAKILAAIAALGAAGGDVILLPSAAYTSSAPITWTTSIRLNGNGSTITFPAGIAGVTMGGAFSISENLSLQGSAIVAGADRGFLIKAPFCSANKVQSQGFGSHNFAAMSYPAPGTVAGQNADNFVFTQCLGRRSYGDGFHVDGSDSNNGMIWGCESQGHLGIGFFDNSLQGNRYFAPNADGSVVIGGVPSGTQAFVLSGSDIHVYGAYSEVTAHTATLSGTGIEFECSSISPPTVVNTGAGAFTNEVRRPIASSYNGRDAITLASAAYGANEYAYGWRINPGIKGRFEFRDLMLGTVLYNYDIVSGSFIFATPVQFTGDITAPSVKLNNTVASLLPHIDTSGVAGVAVAASSHVKILPGAHYGLVWISETATAGMAGVYICFAAGTVMFLGGDARFVAPTTAPGAGQSCIAFDGADYAIYNGSGSSRTFRPGKWRNA